MDDSKATNTIQICYDIASKTTGKRTIAGTDWPVEDICKRVNARRWIILRGLCNGVSSVVEEYTTRRDALGAF